MWTPQGWRVHAKRWGRAERKTLLLSGDGHTSFFPEVLRDPDTHRVEWSDDLHLKDDSFTDGGIYPCDPRVEYPVERPRWAVSHTLLCYPVADHTLFTHEYTWDLVHGHLKTHFRRHVVLEACRTDARDGMTVAVQHRPLSTTIEGNVHYPLPNSAVRGVWGNPDKTGDNYYTQRSVQLLAMHNAVYCIPRRTPVVQCHGMYAVAEDRTARCRVRRRHRRLPRHGVCSRALGDTARRTEDRHVAVPNQAADEPSLRRTDWRPRGHSSAS